MQRTVVVCVGDRADAVDPAAAPTAHYLKADITGQRRRARERGRPNRHDSGKGPQLSGRRRPRLAVRPHHPPSGTPRQRRGYAAPAGPRPAATPNAVRDPCAQTTAPTTRTPPAQAKGRDPAAGDHRRGHRAIRRFGLNPGPRCAGLHRPAPTSAEAVQCLVEFAGWVGQSEWRLRRRPRAKTPGSKARSTREGTPVPPDVGKRESIAFTPRRPRRDP